MEATDENHNTSKLKQTEISTQNETCSISSTSSSSQQVSQFTKTYGQTLKLKELKRIHKLLEKSEQSAFTSVNVGSSQLATNQLINKTSANTITTTKTFSTFKSSQSLSRPLINKTENSTSFEVLKSSTSVSMSSFNNQNFSTNFESTYQHNIPKLRQSPLNPNLDNNVKSYVSSIQKIDSTSADCDSSKISINTDNSFSQYENFSPLPYLPTIHEEHFSSSMLSLGQIQTPASSMVAETEQTMLSEVPTGNVDNQTMASGITTGTQTSQTFLLALPDNFNIDQFSNQTLNLDYNSQQVLRALLQPSLTTNITGNSNEQETATDRQQTGMFKFKPWTEIIHSCTGIFSRMLFLGNC